MSVIRGLTRRTSRHHPRAYCESCSWAVTATRRLSVDRVGELARDHARDQGHETRAIVALVTEYRPQDIGALAARQRLAQATAERTGRTR